MCVAPFFLLLSYRSPAGDELTWLTPSLGVWYGGLLQRDAQYRLWLNTGRPLSFWMTGFFNPQGFLTAVQQEITRAHKHDNWALDSVVLHAEVTDLTFDHVKSPPRVSVCARSFISSLLFLLFETQFIFNCFVTLHCIAFLLFVIGIQEGVYVHGLFMDGAAWSATEGSLVESAPKKLFTQLPVLLVSAVTKSNKKTIVQGGSYGPHGPYDCPVYKYPARTDRYLIFSVMLASSTYKPLHWTLRGVALLCATS
jgi:dynein heavy chain, axonemal